MAFRLFWHIFPPPSTSSSDGLRSTHNTPSATRFRRNSPEFQRRQTRTLSILRFAAPGTTAQNLLSHLKSRERDRQTVSLSLHNNLCCGSPLWPVSLRPYFSLISGIFHRLVSLSRSNRLVVFSAKPSRLYVRSGRCANRPKRDTIRVVFWSSDLRAGSGWTEAMTKSGLRQTNRCDFREDVLVVTLFIVSRRTTSDKSRRFSDDTQSNVPVSSVNPSLHQSITDRVRHG